MSYLLVRHKVHDIEEWKAVFDSHEESRARAGIRTRFLFSNVDDPSEIVLLFEASDMTKVRAFGASRALKDVIQYGGVVGDPDFSYLE